LGLENIAAAQLADPVLGLGGLALFAIVFFGFLSALWSSKSPQFLSNSATET
jgi:hypothetical protein